MSKITYKKDDNNIIETRIINGEEKKRIIPIYDEYGNYTQEICRIAKKEQEKQTITDLFGTVAKSTEANNIEDETTTEFADDFDELDEEVDENLFDGKSKIVNEEKEKDTSKLKKSLATLGLITAGVIITACCLKGCHKEETPLLEQTTISADSTSNNVVSEDRVGNMLEDSRYTTITDEMLADTAEDLIDEFSDHGIEITGEDALSFVAITNITHLEETNPELLQRVLGDDPDAEEELTKVGHIIGQVVTLEVTEKDEQVDWTIAIIDDTDRAIAQTNMNMINEVRKLAADQDLSTAETKTAIQTLIHEEFVAPNYDKTVGYDLLDGTHTALSQEDGADFVTDAIVTGILIGDNEYKNYIYGSETHDDLQAISYNEDSTSNIMRMIEECQNVDIAPSTIERSR